MITNAVKQIMKVQLSELKPNPFRDFKVDPIDPENVEALVQSIKEDGFWGGVVCRKTKDGIEIGAGHTRVEAALKSGIETADLFVGNFTDDQMIRVYARENSTQRGNSTTAVAGSIISALSFLTRAILTNDPDLSRILETSQHGVEILRGQLLSERGIGVPTIAKFLHGVPRLNRYIIEEQLATLKASGDYQRVITEVTSGIETDESRQAAAQVASHKQEFDFAGVAPYMQNEHQLRVFRETVLKPGIKEDLPVSKQAELAKHLIEKAKFDQEELSGRYIRENAGILARDARDHAHKLSREEQSARERADIQAKFDRLCEDFSRHGRGLMESGHELIRFIDAHRNSFGGFRMPQAMKDAIRYATQVLNQLTRAL